MRSEMDCLHVYLWLLRQRWPTKAMQAHMRENATRFHRRIMVDMPLLCMSLGNWNLFGFYGYFSL